MLFIAEPVGSWMGIGGDGDLSIALDVWRQLHSGSTERASRSGASAPCVRPGEWAATSSSKVTYIFKEQLEEADIIVISSSDLLEEAALTSCTPRWWPKF